MSLFHIAVDGDSLPASKIIQIQIINKIRRGNFMLCNKKVGPAFGKGYVLVSLALIFPSTFAHAEKEGSALILEEIVVSAQKREQSLQDVPIAVTAISSKDIEAFGIVNSSGIVRVTPSLTITEGNKKTNSAFSIRGIGTNVFSVGVEQAVATIIDDVPVISQGQSITNLVDIERIEVLRGPQSTLFGKSASAGVISVITKKPAEEFEGNVEYSWTDESENRVVAAISGPIGDSFGYRLSGHWYDHDGWGKNITTGQPETPNFGDGSGFRGKFRWDVSDSISATLGVYQNEEETDCCAFTWRTLDNNSARLLGGTPFAIGEPFADGITPSDENTTIRRDTPAIQETDSDGVNLRVSLDVNDFTLLSISTYDSWEFSADEDVDFGDLINVPPLLGADGWSASAKNELEFYSQEIRLLSPQNESYDYLVGMYYSKQEIDRTFTRNLPIAPANLAAETSSETIALFGQLNWHFSDRATAGFGLRVFEEEVAGGVGTIGAPITINGSEDDSDVVGNLSLQYRLSDDVMIYGSYAKGYKGRAFDVAGDIANFDPEEPVQPEHSDALELGVKSTMWGGRMQLNTTAFYTEYKDFQAQGIDNSSATSQFILDNAGELKTQGIELESVVVLSEQLTLSANAAYIDAEINDYSGAQCYQGQTVSLGCVGGTQTINGGTLPNAPEWKYSLLLDYNHDLDDAPFGLFANIAYTWQDGVRFGIDQNPLTVQGSYGITNLRVGIRDDSDRYEITVFANNLFDEFYAGDVIDFGVLYAASPGSELVHIVPRNHQRYLGIKGKLNF